MTLYVTNVVQAKDAGTVQLQTIIDDPKRAVKIALQFPNPGEVADFAYGDQWDISLSRTGKKLSDISNL